MDVNFKKIIRDLPTAVPFGTVLRFTLVSTVVEPILVMLTFTKLAPSLIEISAESSLTVTATCRYIAKKGRQKVVIKEWYA